jgi:hypothetical protein
MYAAYGACADRRLKRRATRSFWMRIPDRRKIINDSQLPRKRLTGDFMSTLNSHQLIDLALTFPESDRLLIAGELLASVKPPGVMSVEDPGFIEEVQRRCEEIDSGTAELVDYESAMARIRGSLKAREQS